MDYLCQDGESQRTDHYELSPRNTLKLKIVRLNIGPLTIEIVRSDRTGDSC